jgi:hypothetical protein
LSQLSFSGQHRPPLGPSLLTDHLLASSQLPPRPCKGPNSILSHCHTIPLFLLLWTVHPSAIGPLLHLSIVTHIPLVSPVHLDSYITSYLFWQGSPIALIMKAARTSETVVHIRRLTSNKLQLCIPRQSLSLNSKWRDKCDYTVHCKMNVSQTCVTAGK